MCGPSFCLSALPVGSPSLWFSCRSAVGFCGVDGAAAVYRGDGAAAVS